MPQPLITEPCPTEPQAILDRIRDWFLVQNKPRAFLPSEGQASCQYRVFDPQTREPITACAAGCLMLDSHYHGDLEGTACVNAQVIAALGSPSVENLRLIHACQNAHDGIGQFSAPSKEGRIDFTAELRMNESDPEKFRTAFKSRLDQIASAYGLK